MCDKTIIDRNFTAINCDEHRSAVRYFESQQTDR